jgi:AraC family transcriptional regulator
MMPMSSWPADRRVRCTSMNFTAELIDHHVTVLGQLLDRAGTLTDHQLDAVIKLPTDGIDDNPTIRSLLSRLVGQLEMWNAAMASEPYDFDTERHQTIESMRRRLAGPVTHSRASSGRSASRTGSTRPSWTQPDPFPYVFTAAGMIAHVLTYAAHRRTLAVGAFASAGSAELDDDPLTWFLP